MVGLCLHLVQQALVLQNCVNIASGLLPYLRSCCPFSPGKNLSFCLWGLPTCLPPALYWSLSVYLYYSLYLPVFLILCREQNKVSTNQVSASTCSVVFVKRPTFSLEELHLAHAANRMRQKGSPFTALSSHRTHGAHISCCRLVWYQFYLLFNLCDLNTCRFLVSSSSLAENYSLLSHRNMKNILLSNLRDRTY